VRLASSTEVASHHHLALTCAGNRDCPPGLAGIASTRPVCYNAAATGIKEEAMLINLGEYHRPTDLQEALRLLRRPSPRTVPLAGGSRVVGSGDDGVEAVVDLQGLNLRYIHSDGHAGAVRLGAMATLNDLSECDILRSITSGIIARAAHDSAGSVLRNQRTVGGAVAVAGADDQLLVALLAADAQITVLRPEPCDLSLWEVLLRRNELLDGHALVSEVSVAVPAGSIGAALQRVARTPADAPIVCVGAALWLERGRIGQARLALGGVAACPVRLPDVETLLEGQKPTAELIGSAARRAGQCIEPGGDFRGSADYRREMAVVLSERALKQALARASDRDE